MNEIIRNILIISLVFCIVIGILLVTSIPANGAEKTYTVEITFHFVDKISDIPANAGRYPGAMDLGYATWEGDTEHTPPKSCDVYVKLPKTNTDIHGMAVLGHETLHCTHRHFHVPPNR